MLTVFVIVQWAAMVVLIAEIIILCEKKTATGNKLMMVLYFSTLINAVGYYFELIATTKELSIMAIRLAYIGKPFMVLCLFLFSMEFLRIRIPNVLRVILVIFHLFVSTMAFTCEYQHIFYAEIGYTTEGYYPHVLLTQGPLYYIYYAIVLAYMITIMVFAIRRLFEAKKFSNKKNAYRVLSIFFIGLSCFASAAIYFLGVFGCYDGTNLGYLASAIIFLVAMIKFGLKDTETILKETVFSELSDAIVVFDNFAHLVYANELARTLIPEIRNHKNKMDKYSEVCVRLSFVSRMEYDGNYYEIEQKQLFDGGEESGVIFIIHDRTEQLQHTRALEKQSQIAERANRAKTDFLANMSHEIRTPINTIIGMNEMILRESSEKPVKDYAKDIESSAKALLTIINDILDITKIESGKMEIIPVEYDFASIVIDELNLVKQRASEKGLEVKLEIDPNLPSRLYGDDIRIRQIVTNIMTNAVKYTSEGSITIRAYGSVSGDVLDLRTEVEDTGIGIRNQDLQRLFKTFERIDEKKNRYVEGTGLGMSIVKRLLELMGSKIEVKSEYGKGSTFSFNLKQKIVDFTPIGDINEKFDRSRVDEKYAPSFIADKTRVLVVDDNEMNLKVFTGLLRATKLNIDTATSGDMALEFAAKTKYDIIFMDHMMPGKDGIETLHELKADKQALNADTPVVVLTANAVSGAKEMYIKEGFDRFLTKPIEGEKLERTIREMLGDSLISTGADEDNASEENAAGAGTGEAAQKLSFLEEVPEIELDYARRCLGSDELTLDIMKTFYNKIDDELTNLAGYLDTVTSKESLDMLRIDVHALKSSSKSIGALSLSGIARACEKAAREENITRVRELMPAIFDELKALKGILAPLENSDKKQYNGTHEQLALALNKMAEAADNWDTDFLDAAAEALDRFIYEGNLGKEMSLLIQMVQDFRTTEVREQTQRVLALLK